MKPNTMSALSTSRSGDVPDHQEERAEETAPITQEKISQETEHIKIPQNQYTDEAVDVTVVIKETVISDSNGAQKDWEKETQQVDLGWTSKTVNVHVTFL